ncbi:MAG TPA: D-alanyl-D-alanine carboxypeptidase/D-alanyl-D-alanine-endopeptidase [Gaiellaceae bacterium]
MRRGLIAALVVAAAIVPCAAASSLPLPTRLAQALAVRGAPARLSGAVAVDLLTGKTLFARNPDLPLAPASNEKLVVTFAALKELGPAYRFHTSLLSNGQAATGTWQGDLWLKGFGDATLTSAGLKRLALQLKAVGVHRVDGRILGDESWFDARRVAPGWKHGFYLDESPPLSALVIDGDVYEHHLALRPALAAAGRFRQVLRSIGITTGPVGVGRAPADATILGTVFSRPLTAVLKTMNTHSNNFIAEEILKDLGAEAAGAGTTAAGVHVVLADLGAAGIPLTGVRLYDGSGLSADDRLTARAIAGLLLAIWRDPVLRTPVFNSLPVAGETGTLEDRLQFRPARGAVRAKTGTTDLATALSGYVRRQYAFAVLDNGYPVSWNASRLAQDRFAMTLAKTP